MSKLSYDATGATKTDSTKQHRPRLCSQCYKSLKGKYIKVDRADDVWLFPRHLNFCSECAEDYWEAQKLTKEFVSSKRVLPYRVAEVLLCSVAAVVFVAVILPPAVVYAGLRKVRSFV